MINYILKTRTPLFWLFFHLAIGIISTHTPWVLLFWFYLVLATSVSNLIRKIEGTFVPLVLLITYSTSFELLARMSHTSPYIPYELGKYLLFVLLIFGILKGYRKGYIGWLMLFALLPATLFGSSGESLFKNIVFNLIGPINVALAVIFFRKQSMQLGPFIEVMRLMVYPLVSVLAYTILQTPNLDTIEFKLGANFETAGGFGTNQVSTALGLGAFAIFIFLWFRWELTGYRWLDIILFVVFIFRGLLTFSRGGMLGVALGIVTVLLFGHGYNLAKTGSNPIKSIVMIMVLMLALILTFNYADRITKGQLSLRYKGETAATIRGTKQKDLNTFTSNRLEILKDDLKLWKNNPVLGVGVGASKRLRNSSKEYLSHIEISRLLAEHGILGLIYTIILLSLGFNLYRNRKYETFSVVLFALFIVAMFTTFHAAMRTYISPLLIGLSMLTVFDVDTEEITQ